MTNSPVDHIRAQVRSRNAYPRFNFDHIEHRLQWNENPTEFPDKIKQEILLRLGSRKWSDYPQFQPYSLMESLAAVHNLGADQVVLANGSSSLLRTIFWATIDAGDAVVVPSPTFLQYKMLAEVCGGRYVDVPFEGVEDLANASGFTLPVDALIEQAQTQRAKLVVLCAPANPTGTVIPVAEIERIAAACEGLLVLDEAYAHFCHQDLSSLLAKYDNLIIVRTLSKAFAMAGVRCGYMMASPELTTEFNKLIGAFPLDHFSFAATEVALENLDYIAQATDDLIAERDRLSEALDEFPQVRVFPSGTNFVLVHVGDRAKALADAVLDKQNMMINKLDPYPQLAGCVRISVGTRDQNDLLLGAMGAFF